ncbi:MAG TPA: methylated-DNA--[protein]-cysteine S-methyltransferase [Candidatus Kapabacteria bacterium]|nr:methylated-DNA--[protein]-cysteine S-methyltransferase [Candidatus Kapabacteria bacterium]
MYSSCIDTPLGSIILCADDNALVQCYWDDGNSPVHSCPSSLTEYGGVLLQQYFSGKPFSEYLPLNPQGTEFQQSVWKYLHRIPFGATMSYRHLSEIMNNPAAIRAIAHANTCNPLALFIPCHRIIGSDGSLTGYAWGLHRKEWLLHHENALAQQSLFYI